MDWRSRLCEGQDSVKGDVQGLEVPGRSLDVSPFTVTYGAQEEDLGRALVPFDTMHLNLDNTAEDIKQEIVCTVLQLEVDTSPFSLPVLWP